MSVSWPGVDGIRNRAINSGEGAPPGETIELCDEIDRLRVPPPGTVTISVEDHIRLVSSAVPRGYHIEWETCCHYDPSENHPRPVLYRDETCLIGSPPIPRGEP